MSCSAYYRCDAPGYGSWSSVEGLKIETVQPIKIGKARKIDSKSCVVGVGACGC
jgi:hypothetical protein